MPFQHHSFNFEQQRSNMPTSKQAGASKRVTSNAAGPSKTTTKSRTRRKAGAKKSTSTSKTLLSKRSGKRTAPLDEAAEKYLDPWIHCKSQYGGRLSPAEEFKKLLQHSYCIRSFTQKDFPTHCLELNVLLVNDKEESDRFDALQARHCGLACADFTVSISLSTLLVAIDLSHNDITKIELDSACYMRRINLSHNALEAFPTALPHALLHLDLSFNKIESVPQSLHDQAQHLRHLNLESNRLKTIVHVGRCSFLEELRLTANQIDFDNDQETSVRSFIFTKITRVTNVNGI